MGLAGQGWMATLRIACVACQTVGNCPQPVALQPWPWPSGRWEKIHDCGFRWSLLCVYLIVVDAHSKGLEVLTMKSMITEKVWSAQGADYRQWTPIIYF